MAETIKLPFINMESETWDSQLNYLFFTIGRIKLLTAFPRRAEVSFARFAEQQGKSTLLELRSSKEVYFVRVAEQQGKSTSPELWSSKDLRQREISSGRGIGLKQSHSQEQVNRMSPGNLHAQRHAAQGAMRHSTGNICRGSG